MPDGRSYWRREYLCATFIADSDEVLRFGEAGPFSSDAMRNEGRVLLASVLDEHSGPSGRECRRLNQRRTAS
jgi:hypothetical protein